MPGNPSEGLYVVDGFHQLHCLVFSYTSLASSTVLSFIRLANLKHQSNPFLDVHP